MDWDTTNNTYFTVDSAGGDIGLICVAVLTLTIALAGLGGNALLLVTAGRGSGQLLEATVAGANLVVCGGWAPFYVSQLLLGAIHGGSVGYVPCVVSSALFHLAVVTGLIAVASLASRCRDHPVIAYVLTASLLGVASAVYTATNFTFTIEHTTCTATESGVVNQPIASLVTSVFLCMVSVVAVISVVIGRRCERAKDEPNENGKDTQTALLPPVINHVSEEEDDDTFDEKMRLRMKKVTSGRRHTVANISLPHHSPLPTPGRGSPNYHYMRKWSVDIVALQDQLENPRMHTSSPVLPVGADCESDSLPPLKRITKPIPTIPTIPTIVVHTEPTVTPSPPQRGVTIHRVLLLGLSVACITPHLLSDLLMSTAGFSVARTVMAMAYTACLLPTLAAFPLLTSHTQPWHQQWRCVCYCHLGGSRVECCQHRRRPTTDAITTDNLTDHTPQNTPSD